MCGRQCLTLASKDIICACKYPSQKSNKEVILEPEWRAEYNLGKKYEPSHNIAPTDITPVLVSAKHFEDGDAGDDRRVIVPMMWSMIPFWHKGDFRKHGLTTNNCRLESMLNSKLYSRSFNKGQRCVILCEGFYEWQTTKPVKKSSERAAYFIHMPQPESISKIYDKTTWNGETANLMKIAGLYDIWTDDNGDKIYSYTVITYQSNETIDWLHDRMPAILESEEQISDWLDFARVPAEKALAALRPTTSLCWYQVSNEVNNSRNKSENCNKPLSKEDIKKMTAASKQNSLLTSWLIKGESKQNIKRETAMKLEDENCENPEAKRFKESDENSKI